MTARSSNRWTAGEVLEHENFYLHSSSFFSPFISEYVLLSKTNVWSIKFLLHTVSMNLTLGYKKFKLSNAKRKTQGLERL